MMCVRTSLRTDASSFTVTRPHDQLDDDVLQVYHPVIRHASLLTLSLHLDLCGCVKHHPPALGEIPEVLCVLLLNVNLKGVSHFSSTQFTTKTAVDFIS